MIVNNSEIFLRTIVAISLLWWIFISIAMIRSYLSHYHRRTNTVTQTNSSKDQSSSPHNTSPITSGENSLRFGRTATRENQDGDELGDENSIEK
jgi:hypothetical protein